MELEGTTTRSLLVEEMPDINVGDTPIPSDPSSSSTSTGAPPWNICIRQWFFFFWFSWCGYSSPAESGIMEDLGLSTIEVYSVFASIMTIGGMLGAVVSGKIADLIGRRGAMWFCDIFITVGWLAILFAKDIWWLDLGRLTMGFGFGILMYVLMVCGGIALMFFVGNILTWRTLAIFGMFPCLVQFCGLFFIPESPRWLAMIGREKELEDSIRRLRGKNVDIYPEVTEIKDYTETFQRLSKTSILNVFERRYAHPLTQLVSAAGTCLGNILVGLAFLFQDLHQPKELSAILVLSGTLIYSAALMTGMNVIPWLLMSEIFPIHIRGSAGSLVTSVNWFTSWILSMKKGKLAKSKLAKSKSKFKSAKCKSTKVFLKEFDNQGDAQISTNEMPDILSRRSTRIRVAPKSLIAGDFVGPWQRLSNENKRRLRDVESEDSSIECDCVGLCLCGNLGTPRLQMNVEMQASTEQSSKQHQIPNACNTPTKVLTDLEQWPKLTIVSPLAANEMIMSKKLGSPNADQRREVIDTKQRKSVENVLACSNEDLAKLHMEDTQYGKDECLDGDTTAILGKPLQAWSSLLKEEINKVSKMKYKIGAHKIENLVDGMYNVPIEISKKGFSHWENALVGYFIDKRFSFHYVKTWAEKLWGNLLEDVVSIDNGFFIFKVKSEEAIDKILEDGPYYVGARLIVVKKWQPGLKLTK
ncbi:unnamed protein product [Camellia sinensis]